MKLADKKCANGVNVSPLKVLRARELLNELG